MDLSLPFPSYTRTQAIGEPCHLYLQDMPSFSTLTVPLAGLRCLTCPSGPSVIALCPRHSFAPCPSPQSLVSMQQPE